MADQKDHPLVSVLIPAYNHERFVACSLDSLYAQSYRNIEIIIGDDFSRDNTRSEIEERLQHSPFPAKFIKNPSNLGITKTLNRLADECNGEWVCVLASDDYYHEDFVRLSLQFCLENEGCLFTHCDGHYVSEDGTVGDRIYEISKLPPIDHVNSFVTLIEGRARIVAISAFFNKSLMDEVGRFDANLGSEDFDFQLRVARRTPLYFIDKPLVYARRTTGSLGRSPRKYIRDGLIIIDKHKDILGERFQYVRMRKTLRNSEMAFHSGDFSCGLGEGLSAIRMAPGPVEKLGCAAALLVNMAKFPAKAVRRWL